MPSVTTTGTITQDTPGFEFLGFKDIAPAIGFSGTTLPTTLEVGYIDDDGNFQVLTDGTVSSLPHDLIVGAVPKDGLVIEVTGGAPDFVVTYIGPGGALSAS